MALIHPFIQQIFPGYLLHARYSQSFVSTSSAPVDSTNHRENIWGKSVVADIDYVVRPTMVRALLTMCQHFFLVTIPQTMPDNNYLCSIYIVLDIISRHDLKNVGECV